MWLTSMSLKECNNDSWTEPTPSLKEPKSLKG